MKGIIFKRASNISRKEIKDACNFLSILDPINVYSYKDFLSKIYNGNISDNKGFGKLILFDKEVENSSIKIGSRSVYIHNTLIIPLDIIHHLFGNDVKFYWSNIL